MRAPVGDYRLSNEEKRKIDEFISLSSNAPASHEWRKTAFNFLAARKFSVPQALELYQSYQSMLVREEIGLIDPFAEEVRKELLSGKFAVLNDSDSSGARVAQLFVRLCRTSTNHRALLKSILFQLDATMRRETAIRNGLVFIYDMTDAKFSNIDCAFAIKLFKLLQCSYPVRLRRVIILTAPLWFRASFHVMRGFIRDNLRDTVIVLRPSPGTKLYALSHPDPQALRRDYNVWLQQALQRTGWLSEEVGGEQRQRTSSVYGNGHVSYSTSEFFGTTPLSATVAPNTLPDSDHCTPMDGVCSAQTVVDSHHQSTDEVIDEEQEVEDSNSCCLDEMMDDDEDDGFGLSAVADMDPFALSSSYSSEADGSDIVDLSVGNSTAGNSCSTTAEKRCNSSEDSQTTSGRRYDAKTGAFRQSCGLDDGSGEAGMLDHGSTPTPPLAVKRIQLAATGGAKPVDQASKRPVSTPLTAAGGDTLATPTASASSISNIGGAVLKQNSSGCSSSTTSFFSTGSVGGLNSLPRSPEHNSLSDDHLDMLAAAAAGATGRLRSMHRVAPLAEDEIGGGRGGAQGGWAQGDSDSHQSMNNKEEGASSSPRQHQPPSESGLPAWALGRPTGQSIHMGPGAMDVALGSQLDPFLTEQTLVATDRCPSPQEQVTVPESTGNPLPSGASVAEVEDEGADERQPDLLNQDTVSSSTSRSATSSAECSSRGMEEEGVNDEDGELDDDGEEEEEEEEEDEVGQTDSEEEVGQTLSLEEYWMTPEELVNHVVLVGTSGLQDEYSAVVRRKTDDPRSAFKHSRNREKNRYCDVICYEANRVHLRPASGVRSQALPPSSTKSIGLEPAKSLSEAEEEASGLKKCLQAGVVPTTSGTAKDLVHNYIHANWVDGYRQKNAFICTQGPLVETCGDFWQMIWDYHIPVIVMITKVFEAQRPKCYQYWPDTVNKRLYFASGCPGHLPPPASATTTSRGGTRETSTTFKASRKETREPYLLHLHKGGKGRLDQRQPSAEFEVVSTGRQVGEHFVRSSLRLVNLKAEETDSHRVRHVEHFACCSWPDHGVPQTTEGLQQLLAATRTVYTEALARLGYQSAFDQPVPPPPVVVHCSAGIGRTGTYVTADICMKRLTDSTLTDNRVNIPLTVSRIRSQRFGAVQVPPQYLFCYRVLIDFAVEAGLLFRETAQPALDLLTPVSSSPFSASAAVASLFSQSSRSPSSLPRSRDHGLILSGAGSDPVSARAAGTACLSRAESQKQRRTLFELRYLLQTSNFLSIWNAMRPRRENRSETSSATSARVIENTPIVEDDFVMTENVCSDSESDTADLSSSTRSSGDREAAVGKEEIDEGSAHPGIQSVTLSANDADLSPNSRHLMVSGDDEVDGEPGIASEEVLGQTDTTTGSAKSARTACTNQSSSLLSPVITPGSPGADQSRG